MNGMSSNADSIIIKKNERYNEIDKAHDNQPNNRRLQNIYILHLIYANLSEGCVALANLK